jgi:hypothetical protein
MRVLISAILAASLSATGVMADGGGAVGPLAPGKPAGVLKAQGGDNTILYILGAGVVIAGIVLVASSGGNDHPTGTTTTSGTNP